MIRLKVRLFIIIVLVVQSKADYQWALNYIFIIDDEWGGFSLV